MKDNNWRFSSNDFEFIIFIFSFLDIFSEDSKFLRSFEHRIISPICVHLIIEEKEISLGFFRSHVPMGFSEVQSI